METLFIILGSIISLLATLGIVRYINANSLTKSEAIYKLRQYRKFYNRMPESVRDSMYGKSIAKSIVFLEKKVNAHK